MCDPITSLVEDLHQSWTLTVCKTSAGCLKFLTVYCREMKTTACMTVLRAARLVTLERHLGLLETFET